MPQPTIKKGNAREQRVVTPEPDTPPEPPAQTPDTPPDPEAAQQTADPVTRPTPTSSGSIFGSTWFVVGMTLVVMLLVYFYLQGRDDDGGGGGRRGGGGGGGGTPVPLDGDEFEGAVEDAAQNGTPISFEIRNDPANPLARDEDIIKKTGIFPSLMED